VVEVRKEERGMAGLQQLRVLVLRPAAEDNHTRVQMAP
jgi:hypothetical protein